MSVDLLLGSVVHEHRILELLHDGGGGRVYLVDYRGNTRVMKTLGASSASQYEFAARFEREKMVLARLSGDAAIPELLGEGEYANGAQCFFMKHAKGVTLELELKLGQLPLKRAVAIAVRLAAALSRVHAIGVVHRDLKPRNIMVNGEQVVLLDFGDAAVERSTLTAATADDFDDKVRDGSADEAEDESLPSRDVRDLGRILKAMFGERPPKQLRLIVDRCCAEDPAARYAARDLHDVLAAYARGPRLMRPLIAVAALAALAMAGMQLASSLAVAELQPPSSPLHTAVAQPALAPAEVMFPHAPVNHVAKSGHARSLEELTTDRARRAQPATVRSSTPASNDEKAVAVDRRYEFSSPVAPGDYGAIDVGPNK